LYGPQAASCCPLLSQPLQLALPLLVAEAALLQISILGNLGNCHSLQL
jgi:hypothetical protein